VILDFALDIELVEGALADRAFPVLSEEVEVNNVKASLATQVS